MKRVSFVFLIAFAILLVVGCSTDKFDEVGNTRENKDTEIESNFEEIKETLSEETKSEIETKLLKNFIIINDDIKNIDWYYTKGSLGSERDFAFYIYMGERDDEQWLRLVTGFNRDDWIFFEKVKVLADDYVFEIPFDNYYDKTEGVKNGTNEFIDVPVDEQLLNDLIKVSNAEYSKIRFIGKDHSKDYEINLSKKIKMEEMIDYFNFKHDYYEGLLEKYMDKENILHNPFIGYWKTNKVLSAFKPTDEGTSLQNIEIYRSYDESGNMIDITIDAIGEWVYERNYKVLSDKEIENQTKDGYNSFDEEYSFESDRLIIYSYKNHKKYIFERISKEEFEQVLERQNNS